MLKQLAKSILIPLGLTAAAAATDSAFHETFFGSSFTKLIISNKQTNDITKIVNSLQESWFLIKGVSEQHEAKEQKEECLSMLLGTFDDDMLGREESSVQIRQSNMGQYHKITG